MQRYLRIWLKEDILEGSIVVSLRTHKPYYWAIVSCLYCQHHECTNYPSHLLEQTLCLLLIFKWFWSTAIKVTKRMSRKRERREVHHLFSCCQRVWWNPVHSGISVGWQGPDVMRKKKKNLSKLQVRLSAYTKDTVSLVAPASFKFTGLFHGFLAQHQMCPAPKSYK